MKRNPEIKCLITAMNLMSSVKFNNQMSSEKISHFKVPQCSFEQRGLVKQINGRKLPTIYSKPSPTPCLGLRELSLTSYLHAGRKVQIS